MTTQDNKPQEDEVQETETEAAAEEGEAAAEAAQQQGPIAALEAEVAELKDKLLRALADGENVRRRAERDKADASKFAITGFARDLLSVADNLRRALDSLPEELAEKEELKNFVAGVEMTERELLNSFEKHGIKPINPQGEKFDHNFHQAMFEVETADQAPGTVVQVMQTGYVLNDRLLRPAMVGVAKQPSGNQPGGTVDTKA